MLLEYLFTFYLFSFIPLLLFTTAIWYQIKNGKQFGRRPKILFRSIIILFVAGLFLTLVTALSYNSMAFRTMEFTIIYTLYLYAFFLLEYSIHHQRIDKSYLTEDHYKSYKPFLKIISLMIFLCIFFIFYNIIDIFVCRIPFKDMGIAKFIIQSGFILITIYPRNGLFNFQPGVLRVRKYSYDWLIFLGSLNIILDFFWKPGILRFFYFLILNIVYVFRVYEEYFFYRVFHITDLLSKQSESKTLQTKLLNRASTGSLEEDYIICSELLKLGLKKTLRDLPLPQQKIISAAIYRLKDDKFYVMSSNTIIGYCPPLYELKTVKKKSENEIKNILIKKTYSYKKINESPDEELETFGEKALKRMIKTKKEVYINPIPKCYFGIFRLIVLFPIFNNDDISGFIILYKDLFDKLFMHETLILREVCENINNLYLLMQGKEYQEEKNRLQEEMKIAENIQTSILPKNILFDGYDISCSMTTATEVGGDTYDFAQNKFGNYLSIGDVSGHGVPAGIMALLETAAFQTAVNASELLNKEISITDMYDLINKVLCRLNSKRIGSDKFMTGNLFVEKKGSFEHSGAHEIALLYKKKERKITELRDCTVKTAFLGISDKIKSDNSKGNFVMEKGDTLMLYTDGLIEAKNEESEQYGINRLKNIFSKCITENTDEIIDIINTDIKNFAENGDLKKFNGFFADDITIIIIRKK